MVCYKDKAFCSFYEKCISGQKCSKALTQEIKQGAINAKLPVAQFVQKPACFNERKKRTHIKTSRYGEIKLIPVGDIYYFMAEHKYITVRHKQGETIANQPMSLKTLKQELEDDFILIHHNALVAKKHLTALLKPTKTDVSHALVLIEATGERIGVSRRNLSSVRKFLRKKQFA